jgi:hypothetical protein
MGGFAYFALFVFPLPFCPFGGLLEAAATGAGAGAGGGAFWAAAAAILRRVTIKYPERMIPMTMALTLMKRVFNGGLNWNSIMWWPDAK